MNTKTKQAQCYHEAGVTYAMEIMDCPPGMTDYTYHWNYNGHRGTHNLQTYNREGFRKLLAHWNRNDKGWRYEEIGR
jgi:hypothetical protein